jgi:predicted RNase H-like HicB family nuclease
MRYLVVLKEGPSSFGAYVPDLPGCVAAGEAREEALALVRLTSACSRRRLARS